MPSFFEPPPPPPDEPPQPPRQPWQGAPDAAVGRAVALNVLLGRSAKAAVWIPWVTVYAEGFEFDVEVRHRLDIDELDDPFGRHGRGRHRRASEGIDPQLLRFGLELADGRRATSLGPRMPFRGAGEPDLPPEQPVLWGSRGGGGGGGRWHFGYWFWPLPPEGPLAFVCEWPAAGIAETRNEIDSAPIRAAAREVIELWPEDAHGTRGRWSRFG